MKPLDLKLYRVRTGITQTELAARLNVNQSQVSRWERGVQAIPGWLKVLIECWEGKNDHV